ncbi:O-antigen ligase family protein [Ruminococcus sp. FC2018]|uniref:O-antigen ligase family protein n=1 Tax=Ruminococcus sp. FC2018 TaxID=1410617 RepID=UPI00048DCF00|nr:O-antigen ligase family protein [Ruminococcus sp. FC2018]
MAEQKSRERKHLFGTTEKSDFILNMNQQQTFKLCGLYSIIAIAVLAAINIPFTILKHTFDYVDEDNITHYADDLIAHYASILVVGAGLIGFWFFLVGRMKKEIVIKDNKLLLIPAFIIAVSAWSMFASGNISTCFFGYLDRSEGLLTILAYWGFFAAGMAVTGDKWRQRFTDFLAALGLLNAVVGILQSIPALYDVMPNKFKDLFVRFGATPGAGEIATSEGIYEKGYAASGLLITPFALAAVMTLVIAITLTGFALVKSGKKKAFYGVTAISCTAAAVLTKTLVGAVGAGAAVVAALVIACVKAGVKKQKIPVVLALCAAAAAVGCAAVLYTTGAAQLKDEQVMYTETNHRLSVGNPREEKSQWIYEYMWSDGAYVIQQHPVVGVGPDNWSEMFELKLTADRVYNQYLDVGMQRGVICLGLYGLFLIVTVVKLGKAVKKHFKDEENVSWVAAGLMAAVIAYMIQAFFNSGNNYSTPYFMLITGMGWSYFGAKAGVGKKKGKAKK